MGKMRRFLGLLTCLFIFAFGASDAFAVTSCTKCYSSCKSGYTFNANGNGVACGSCEEGTCNTSESCPSGYTAGGSTYNACETTPGAACYKNCTAYNSGGYRYTPTSNKAYYDDDCSFTSSCITPCSSVSNTTATENCLVPQLSALNAKSGYRTCSGNYTTGCSSAGDTCSGCSSWDACVPTECQTNYTLNNDTCDPTTCTTTNAGIDHATAVSGNLVDGCCATSCGTGYHVDNCECAADSSVSCNIGQYVSNNTCYNCTNKPAGNTSVYTSSSLSSCPWTCVSGYVKSGGTCKRIIASCSGHEGQEYHNGSWETCPQGEYCDGTGYVLDGDTWGCYETCPDGTTSAAGSTSIDDCVGQSATCSAGKYLDGSTCKTCPANSVCNSGVIVGTCSSLTGGTHPYSVAGTSDVANCYKSCSMVGHATAMTGYDYYTATDTCAPQTCESGYSVSGNQCVAASGKFSVTTTAGTTSYQFQVYAGGTYTVNCGDGGTLSVTGSYVNQNGNQVTTYPWGKSYITCSWNSAGEHTITLDGSTHYSIHYSDDTSDSTIRFPTNTKSVSGSLADLFSQYGTDADEYPHFYNTFRDCTNLTSIPDTLFKYSSGGGLDGGEDMFELTFYGCTGLTSIPAGLFSTITTGADFMFYDTFYGCTNLSGYIPPTTFAGLINAGSPDASFMWRSTFGGTNLATSCTPYNKVEFPTGYETQWGYSEGNVDSNNGTHRVSCYDCPIGQYGTTGNCAACTNTKPANSYYSGSATTNNCPWACNASYYKNGNACTSCNAGQYSAAGATSCSTCTNTKPANSYYSGSATTNNCPWACDASYYKNGNACTSCNAGQYSAAGATSCSTCTNTKPANSHYSGNATSNNCPWECDASYYKNGNTCTQCATGQWSSAGGTCNTCSNKPANSSYTTPGTSSDCPWQCDGGYHLDNGQCVENTVTCTAGKTYSGATCPAGSYCPGGTRDTAEQCSPSCPTDPQGGTISSPSGSKFITDCQTMRTGVELADHTGGGNQVCNYVNDTDKYKNCLSISIKYCNAGRYRAAADATTCAPVGTGNWSPAPTNTIEDNVSMARYSCSKLPGYTNATTTGEASGLPTACFNTCSTKNILDSANNVIGSSAPVSEKVNFNGTITTYNATNQTVTTSGSYPACTYQVPVCNPGYKLNSTNDGCVPKVYRFILNKNGGTGGTNGPIYMKYNTGWYFDAGATTSITTIMMPSKESDNCSGYEATIGGNVVSVINATGQIIVSNTLVNYDDTSTPTTLTASWVAKQTTTCNAGQYFSDTDNSCKPCPDGFWCEGGTVFSGPDSDGNDHYKNACPTATIGSTYTPAQTWNGSALVNVAPNVHSDGGRNEETDCFATVQYTASKGKGSQVCHYAAGKYSSNCSTIQMLTCDSGYWLNTSQTSTDCSKVGYQYYSATYLTTRNRCPEATYDVTNSNNTISTDNDESGSIDTCVREGIWERTAHGGRIKRCHWSSVNNTYSINCGNSFTMRKCDAGYWDALVGATTDDDELDCVPVGDGYWSPAPANWNATTTADPVSTVKTACPIGTGAVNVVSTTPSTGIQTAGSVDACFLTCKPTITIDRDTSNVKNPDGRAYFETSTNKYQVCVYDKCPTDMWCDENGPHLCPSDKDGVVGSADFDGREYRAITQCYILYNPWRATSHYPSRTWGHGTGWVRAFYVGNSTRGDYTNYYNVGALTCDAGYYYDASMTCSDVHVCKYSPAQAAFPSEQVTIENPGSSTQEFACPDGCSGSNMNATKWDQCYKTCPESINDFPHSVTVTSADTNKRVFANSATTYPACKYNITCADGYEPKNNGTATPTCEQRKYTITLNKNGGMGSTPASVQCTFNSGTCTLPSIVDTRTGYTTARKWCTEADGTGVCYNAGTTITTNISADASNITLFAQWTPNVYKIILNHNYATTAGVPSTVYLKYATGWYSNLAATVPITQMATKPVKGAMAFAGYRGNNVTVIDSDGKFVTSATALTFTSTETTIMAQWADAPITCPAKTYYAGTGYDATNPNVCKPCPVGHYCEGVTVQTGSGEAGLEPCPVAIAGTNYTPAQTWDGTVLTNVAPNVNSPAESSSVSQCYATVQYVATHGKGKQLCHFANGHYASDCEQNTINMLTCNAGYWLQNASDTNCSAVGRGNYSGSLDTVRYQCPNGGTTASNNINATSINECYKENLGYTAVDGSGSGTQSCWYTNGTGTSAVYNRDCFDKVITSCRGGYYLVHNTDVVCGMTDKNYYSNEGDISQHACPGTGKTRNKATVTIDLCYEDGLDYVAEHGGGSQTCFWSINNSAYDIGCGDKKITYCNGGYWLAEAQDLDCIKVGYASYSPYPDLTKYACGPGMTTLTETSDSADDCFTCPAGSVCDPTPKSCSELTGGEYTKSDPGTTNVAYCYKDCISIDNARSVTGRDYYTAEDTCRIDACDPGYTAVDGVCVVCPAGSYCDGEPGNDGQKSCSDLDDGSWMYSETGSTKDTDCYRICTEHAEDTCILTPLESIAHWPNYCQYTGKSATGNPAEIRNGICTETECNDDFEMINGVCHLCDRDNALSYQPNGNCIVESCTMGYHPNFDQCEEDVRECTEQSPNATYAEQHWDAIHGSFGVCVVKSCEDGYHLASNACVVNEQVCDVENGVGLRTWNAFTKSWNACIATSCVPGYTNDPYEKNNASEQCSECRNKFSTLGEVAASSYVTGCEIASCMYQGEKYNLENNECVPICATPYSDETGSIRWNDRIKKCERTCNPGYISW